MALMTQIEAWSTEATINFVDQEPFISFFGDVSIKILDLETKRQLYKMELRNKTKE
jgi:hypothetical protein